MLKTVPVVGQAFGFELEGRSKSVIIPFEIHNNLIVVPIVLNKAVPLRFIVDSGVKTAILTDKLFSDILNVDYDRKIKIIGADGSKEMLAYVARNVYLDLPGVSAVSQSILVLEDDYLELSKSVGTPIHGIIGYELFRRFVVKIDYRRRYITLYEPAYFKPRKAYDPLPLHISDAKPYITAEMYFKNGETIRAKFLIDTGASHTVLFNIGSHDGISLPDPHIPRLLGKGLGGDIKGNLGRVNEISIGKFSFEEPIVSFAEKESYAEIFRETGRNGSIGGGLMSRFTVVFDYFNETLYLRKNANYRDEFDYNMSGIDLIADGRYFKKFVVHDVAEDSPADEVGIEEGDEILSINAYDAENFTLSDFSAFFRLRENKTIRLVINRDGQRLKKKFKLERIL